MTATKVIQEIRERPILFSGPMVKAILDGGKSQTRRVLTQQPPPDYDFIRICAGWAEFENDGTKSELGKWSTRKPYYGQVGDRLWCRETFYIDLLGYSERERLPSQRPEDIEDLNIYYRADGECCQQIPECACAEVGKPKWRPSIFMPRWASRISLEITDIRVERVQAITEEDAIAEGMNFSERVGFWTSPEGNCLTAALAYRYCWDSINKKRGFDWNSNPCVWVISFKRIKQAH